MYTAEEHHVAVYAGRDNQTIVKADRPKDLLRNRLLPSPLVASIMNAKYVNRLHLCRISQEFLRNDIHISKQVMANWIIQCADRHLGILYAFLHKELYRFHVLQTDEPSVMVAEYLSGRVSAFKDLSEFLEKSVLQFDNLPDLTSEETNRRETRIFIAKIFSVFHETAHIRIAQKDTVALQRKDIILHMFSNVQKSILHCWMNGRSLLPYGAGDYGGEA